DRSPSALGSAGCQPAAAGSMPTTFNCPASGESSKQSRQAAETCRLATCAPQMACCASRLGSLTAKALVDCRLVVPPHSSAWVHQAVAQFRVTVPVEARPADVALAAEQPAIGRPSQRSEERRVGKVWRF